VSPAFTDFSKVFARAVGAPKKTESKAAGSNNATSLKNARSESPAIGIPSIGLRIVSPTNLSMVLSISKYNALQRSRKERARPKNSAPSSVAQQHLQTNLSISRLDVADFSLIRTP
jgi:hypothetical protein